MREEEVYANRCNERAARPLSLLRRLLGTLPFSTG